MSNPVERLKQRFKSRVEEGGVGPGPAAQEADLWRRLYSLCSELDTAVPVAEAERERAIEDLTSATQSLDLTAELEDLWQLVESFASVKAPERLCNAALRFLKTCVHSKQVHGELLRLSIFKRVISDEWGRRFLDVRLDILKCLTNDGRDLREAEQDIFNRLAQWIDEASAALYPAGVRDLKSPMSEAAHHAIEDLQLAQVRSLLSLVVNVVKFSFIRMHGSQISQVMSSACSIASRTPDIDLIRDVLMLLDAVVRYGTVPLTAIPTVTATLVHTVNADLLTQQSWQIMRNLLKSHRARHIMKELFTFLTRNPNTSSVAALGARGAIFFIGMSNWGSQRVKSLNCRYVYLLPYLQRATQWKNVVIDTEVLLAIRGLIVQNTETLTVLDWEAIVDILGGISAHLETGSGGQDVPGGEQSESFMTLYNNILELVLKMKYLEQGSIVGPRVLDILLRFGPHLSDIAAYPMIEYLCNIINYAAYSDMVQTMATLLDVFFLRETRPNVRLRVLHLLRDRYATSSPVEEEELFDVVITPMLRNLPKETNLDIFRLVVDFLASQVRDSTEKQFTAIIEVLVQCSLNSQSDAVASILMLAELLSAMAAQTAVAVTPGSGTVPNRHSLYAIKKVFAICEICAKQRGGRGCLLIFKYLVRIPTFHNCPKPVRLACLKYLLAFRAGESMTMLLPSYLDATQASSVDDNDPDNPQSMEPPKTLVLCPSLSCSSRLKSWPADVSDEPTTDADLPATPTTRTESSICHIPIAQHAAALMLNLTREKDWDVYTCIMQGLPNQLLDLSFFQSAGPQLTVMRAFFCDMIVNERAAVTVKNIPTTVRKSDIYLTALNILTILLAYRSFFTRQDQDEMLVAFQTGLYRWPSAAKNCIHAFTLALHELPQSMTKLLPGTLLKVSQMMSTAMAVHNLQFLATLARLPSLRVNFTDTDVKRVFVIALQYINTTVDSGANSTPTSPVNLYIVQLAYQVLLAWFVTLKLPERKKYVPFIIHYLLLRSSRQSKDLDENIELVLDLLIYNSFADCWSKPPDTRPLQSGSKPGKLPSRTWVQGNSLLTSQVSSHPGWIDLTIRRPAGVIAFSVRLENRFKATTASMLPLVAPVAFEQLMSSRRAYTIEKGRKESAAQGLRRSDSDGFSRRRHVRSNSLASIAPLQLEFPAAIDIRGKSDLSLLSNRGEDSPISEYFPDDIPLRRGRSSSMSSAKLPEGLDLIAPNLPTTRYERSDEGPVSQSPSARSFIESARPAALARDEQQASLDPSFLLAQFIHYPNLQFEEPSVLLPEDDAITRGVSVLDRTPVIDLHKIGVVYVGPDQTTEAAILNNTHGSRNYGYFLQTIGRFVRLKGCRDIYTGGLDTNDDLDGRHAIYAQDDLSQIIFHTTTLMPTLAHDPACTSKKRHIGNDYVTIVWNESGRDYAFDTIPAQFNFVNIIIEPAGGSRSDDSLGGQQPAREWIGGAIASAASTTSSLSSSVSTTASFANVAPVSVVTDKGFDAFQHQFFRVIAKQKQDMPETGPLGEPKLVSGASLGAFVRQNAVQANIFSQIFQNSGNNAESHTSNARERLRQIKRIKERAVAAAVKNGNRAASTEGADGSGAAGGNRNPVVDEREILLDFTRFT